MLHTIIIFVIDKKTKIRKMISGSGSSIEEVIKELEIQGFHENEYNEFINENFYNEGTYFFEDGNQCSKEVWWYHK